MKLPILTDETHDEVMGAVLDIAVEQAGPKPESSHISDLMGLHRAAESMDVIGDLLAEMTKSLGPITGMGYMEPTYA